MPEARPFNIPTTSENLSPPSTNAATSKSKNGVLNGSPISHGFRTPPVPTFNSRQPLSNIRNLGGGLNASPSSVVGNSHGFRTPNVHTLNSREPLSNITNLGGVLTGSPTSESHGFHTPPLATLNTIQALSNITNLEGVLNAESNGIDSTPLPMYPSRQPPSNITNVSGTRTTNRVHEAATRSTATSTNNPESAPKKKTVPRSDIFKNLFASTNSPQSCTTQNVRNRSVDTTQVRCSRLFQPTNDDTNYEEIENSCPTDIPSEDEELLSDYDGSEVSEDSSELEPFEDAPPMHQVPNGYASLGPPTECCNKCHAIMWKEERVNKNVTKGIPKFSTCCGQDLLTGTQRQFCY
ncbi:hypothetical protein ACET3Z_013289 [Daucus carota]